MHQSPSRVLDSAALYPAIAASFDTGNISYFAACNKARQEILATLSNSLHCPHTLFLTGNTSTGIVGILLGLFAAGRHLKCLLGCPYVPYTVLLEYLLANNSGNSSVVYATHICPLTGTFVDIKHHTNEILLVDAAQSLGTIFNNILFAEADIFAAPLHKHLGIAAGLGIVGVNESRIDSDVSAVVIETIEMMQHGTMHLSLLQKTLERLQQLDGKPLLNSARVRVSSRLVNYAISVGLRVLTPFGIQAHSVCFTASEPHRLIENLIDVGYSGGKLFKTENVLRLSFHSVIDGDLCPEEFEKLAINRLVPLES